MPASSGVWDSTAVQLSLLKQGFHASATEIKASDTTAGGAPLADGAPVFVWGYALEAVGFVASGDLAFAQADDCETLGSAEA
jgi:hypothetical protein